MFPFCFLCVHCYLARYWHLPVFWCVCVSLSNFQTIDYAEQLRIMQKTKEKLEIALEKHQDCTYLCSPPKQLPCCRLSFNFVLFAWQHGSLFFVIVKSIHYYNVALSAWLTFHFILTSIVCPYVSAYLVSISARWTWYTSTLSHA